MNIRDMDISDIPSDYMEKLASIVTNGVWINNMTPTSQLGSILASVQSTLLVLRDMDLTEADTQALVTAMSHRLDTVWLWPGVTLDLDDLASYDGRGRCTRLAVHSDTRTRYGERLRSWAERKGLDSGR